jgi:hypothetical protein
VPGHSGLFGRGVGIGTITVDISKAVQSVPHDLLLTKLAASGVGKKVVVCVREFLVGRTQRVTVGGKLF